MIPSVRSYSHAVEISKDLRINVSMSREGQGNNRRTTSPIGVEEEQSISSEPALYDFYHARLNG